MRTRRFIEGPWEWIEARTWPGSVDAPQGEHVFYSTDRTRLMEIAQQEVSRCTVFTARISRTPSGSRGEYVLHLFDHDGDRSTNLSFRYGGMAGVRYTGWRGETCTIRDLYEKMCTNKHEIGMK